jgi:hypothetical protein
MTENFGDKAACAPSKPISWSSYGDFFHFVLNDNTTGRALAFCCDKLEKLKWWARRAHFVAAHPRTRLRNGTANVPRIAKESWRTRVADAFNPNKECWKEHGHVRGTDEYFEGKRREYLIRAGRIPRSGNPMNPRSADERIAFDRLREMNRKKESGARPREQRLELEDTFPRKPAP